MFDNSRLCSFGACGFGVPRMAEWCALPLVDSVALAQFVTT